MPLHFDSSAQHFTGQPLSSNEQPLGHSVELHVYKSVKLLNDTLIVVFKDGKILTKNDATKEDYQAVLDCKTTIEIKEKINVEHNIETVVGNVTWKTRTVGRITKID